MKKEPTILVVDDTELNQDLISTILTKEGYRVLCAGSGPDARKIAAFEKPDLILLDVKMPGEDGFETCIKLKHSPITSDIPVIFVSSLDDPDSKVRGLSIGGVDYITKPFYSAEILARTRLHLNLKRAYEALVKVQYEKMKKLSDAQQAIFVRPKDIPDARFGVCYRAVQEAGGDFYDVLGISRNIFGYFVADVSGHDIEAAYYTAALKALMSQNARPGHTPVETVIMINRVLSNLMKDGQHITGCYAYLNRARKKLIVVSAGHPPVIHINSRGKGSLIESSGDILGAFENIILEPCEKKLLPGDRFFLYSDGLIESCYQDKISREEGIERLMKAGVETMNLPVGQAVNKIISRLFPDAAPPSDDIVLLSVDF